MYSLDRTIDATVEPVTVAQAQSHARVAFGQDNDLIANYITAARQYCEEVTGRAFLQQTWRLSRDNFPRLGCASGWGFTDRSLRPNETSWGFWRNRSQILLPRPKLIGIGSITYLDQTGTRQTVDPSQYAIDFDGEPAGVSPVYGAWWPFALPQPGSVQVTYNAGYGTDPTAVPGAVVMAVLQIVAHWYENREAAILPDSGSGLVSIPFGVAEMLQPYVLDEFTYES